MVILALYLIVLRFPQVLENQVREPGGTFYERLLHTVEASMATHGIPGRCKDDVTLPLEGGWRWDGDWEVDPSWVHSGTSNLVMIAFCVIYRLRF